MLEHQLQVARVLLAYGESDRAIAKARGALESKDAAPFARVIIAQAHLAKSDADLAEKLRVSKASASTNARLLEELGILAHTARPGDRRDYYQRADNHGEGGIFALLALIRQGKTKKWVQVGIGTIILVGAALLYGDGIITPSISVLSAIEGLKVATLGLEKLVAPLTVLILNRRYFLDSIRPL